MIKVLEICITCLVNSFCIFHDFLDQVYLCIELPTSIRRNFQQAPSVSSPFDHQSEIYLLLNPSEVGNIYISAFLIFPCTLLTYRSHLITEIYLYLIWMSHIIYNQISSFFSLLKELLFCGKQGIILHLRYVLLVLWWLH